MTDTTILPNVPAYVQLDNNNDHNYGYNYGISTKDRLHSDADFSNLQMRGLSIDVERNGRSAELATEKTAAAIMMVTSHGFCDVKQKIIEDGEKTRVLISLLDNQRLANLLVAANQELLAVRLERCFTPTTCVDSTPRK